MIGCQFAVDSAASTNKEESPEKTDVGGDSVGRPARPLEQEPLLAARIMVEDCMALLLDVEDIDRIFIATDGQSCVGSESWISAMML